MLDAPVSRETASVKLLTSVPPKGATSSLAAAVGPHSQEQAAGDHWCSAPNLSEDPMARKLVAGTGLVASHCELTAEYQREISDFSLEMDHLINCVTRAAQSVLFCLTHTESTNNCLLSDTVAF